MKKRKDSQFTQVSKKALAMMMAFGMVFSLFQNNFNSYAEDNVASEPVTAEVQNTDNTEEQTPVADDTGSTDTSATESEDSSEAKANTVTTFEEDETDTEEDVDTQSDEDEISLASDLPESTDLTQFVKSVVLTQNGTEVTDWTTLKEGVDYTLQLTFQEEDGSTQFANTSSLTYKVPDAINIAKTVSDTFTIQVNDADGTYYLYGNTWTLDTNGNLTVNFNQNDANFKKFCEVENVAFYLNFGVSFDEQESTINFGHNIIKNIVVTPDTTEANVKADKDEGWFTSNDDKVNFKAYVTSTKTNTNVKGDDTFSGPLYGLTDVSDISVSSNIGSVGDRVHLTLKEDGMGFNYTIDSMSDGEIIYFQYAAKVKFDKDSTSIKKTDIKNVFTTSSDENKNTDDDKVEKNINNDISYRYINKKGGEVQDTDDENIKKMTWTISLNDLDNFIE